MASKIPRARMDHAIELYLSGKPLEQIRADTGVAFNTLAKERKRRGIPPRSERKVPSNEIVAAYLAGASENALALQYGVSRGVIAKRLAAAGVKRRGMSEAGLLRNKTMSARDRKKQAAAANQASRLRNVPQIAKLRNALAKEAKGCPESPGETVLYEMLKARGIVPTKQRAIGVYNVDMAVLPVAVEVLGGGWHSLKSTHTHRTPYILDEGWHLIMVWDTRGVAPSARVLRTT